MIKTLLVFLAGLLLGANALYYAVNQGWMTVARSADTTAPAASSALPCTPDDASIVQPPASTQPDASAQPATSPTGSDAQDAPAPASTPASPIAPASTMDAPSPDAVALPGNQLLIPVAGVTASQLHDTFRDARSEGRVHDAIDIMAPSGTPVYAVADGKVVKLFNSRLGGITLYQFDATETWVYYYAHLQDYAPGVHEGMLLKRGDVLGHVGYTGNASPEGPHLHFAVSLLGADKSWWKATAINPYPLLGGKPVAIVQTPATASPAASTQKKPAPKR